MIQPCELYVDEYNTGWKRDEVTWGWSFVLLSEFLFSKTFSLSDILHSSMNDILLEEEKEGAKKYRFSLWWVEHRELLKKIGIRSFIVLDALILLFVFWSLIDAFAIRYDAEQKAISEVVLTNQEDLHAYTASRTATPLSVAETQVFSTGNSQYDLYTEMNNANADWWAEFTYKFSYDGGETKETTGFILPTQKKSIAELAVQSNSAIGMAQFQLVSVSWHRVDHHQIADYTKWSSDRLNIEIKSPTFLQDTQIKDTTISRTTFTVVNHTAYSYFHPTFIVLLKRGTSVIGVNRTALQSLDSGEAQDVALSWFGVVPGSAEVQVIPDINLFDSGVYKALVGTPSIDTRNPTGP